jgi:hypothetical protein
MRGLAKVIEQCLLTACGQNIKKMPLLLPRGAGDPKTAAISLAHDFSLVLGETKPCRLLTQGFVINLYGP